MEEQKTPKSGLLFTKGFIKFSAIFMICMLLLMAFLHWRKGDYRLQTEPDRLQPKTESPSSS